MSIPVIDLFAGPGGLGEGFSSFIAPDGNRPFQIKLSIEKDFYAHQTLELRSFFRKFAPGQAPNDYYRYLERKITKSQLFEQYREQAAAATKEAWKAELGGRGYSYSHIDNRIEQALNGAQQWLLIGGPPCQAYSLAGRSRMRGSEPHEHRAFEQDRRHLLYQQYLRILARHRPTIFIMENVKGILSSTMKGDSIFARILKDLRHPDNAINGTEAGLEDDGLSYEIFPLVRPLRLMQSGSLLSPGDYVVRSEEFGIPQARHRVFLLGVRTDAGIAHCDNDYLVPSEIKPTVEQVIGDLPPVRSQVSKGKDSTEEWQRILRSVRSQSWLQNPEFASLRNAVETVTEGVDGTLTPGGEYREGNSVPSYNPDDWYSDVNLSGIFHHTTRGHLPDDLKRYLFAAIYARQTGRSPTLNNFPAELLPLHKNVTEAIAKGSMFSDRFRVQVRDRPSTTVMSHISKDGHYFIHFDPRQCRSLTVREAARLQTFPDNYFFEGPRTQQYHQVGNAVPPLLAVQAAAIIYNLITRAE